jgi:hypothetical protein
MSDEDQGLAIGSMVASSIFGVVGGLASAASGGIGSHALSRVGGVVGGLLGAQGLCDESQANASSQFDATKKSEQAKLDAARRKANDKWQRAIDTEIAAQENALRQKIAAQLDAAADPQADDLINDPGKASSPEVNTAAAQAQQKKGELKAKVREALARQVNAEADRLTNDPSSGLGATSSDISAQARTAQLGLNNLRDQVRGELRSLHPGAEPTATQVDQEVNSLLSDPPTGELSSALANKPQLKGARDTCLANRTALRDSVRTEYAKDERVDGELANVLRTPPSGPAASDPAVAGALAAFKTSKQQLTTQLKADKTAGIDRELARLAADPQSGLGASDPEIAKAARTLGQLRQDRNQAISSGPSTDDAAQAVRDRLGSSVDGLKAMANDADGDFSAARRAYDPAVADAEATRDKDVANAAHKNHRDILGVLAGISGSGSVRADPMQVKMPDNNTPASRPVQFPQA